MDCNSARGIDIFNQADYRGDFFRMAHHYSRQLYNDAICGAASIRIVLAALYDGLGRDPVIDLEHSLILSQHGKTRVVRRFTEAAAFRSYDPAIKTVDYYDFADYHTMTRRQHGPIDNSCGARMESNAGHENKAIR